MANDFVFSPTLMGYGVMRTPGIVINEKVMGSGGVPTGRQMIQLIQQWQKEQSL